MIITIFCFDYFQIKHLYLDYYDSIRLNKAIVVGIEINHVVHELQKERGITVGYLSNDGAEFSEELAIQRHHTDSTLGEFYKEIINPELDDLMLLHEDDINYLMTFFNKISELRDQVDELTISPDQTIKYFSEINTVALKTVNLLINETRDKQAAQQVHAIIYFLESKEYASIERAVGTQAFSMYGIDKKMLGRFTELVASQSSYLDAFITISDQESIDFYERTVTGFDVDEVNRMRESLYSDTELSDDPNYWYKVSTGKINSLKMVEDFMSENMRHYTESISKKAQQDFWTFVIVDLTIGIFTLLLMGYIVSNLIMNVRFLEVFTRKVIKGDLSQRVDIKTKDEIGHYAMTFNLMINEINKSQKALKEQKDKAEYLYENIYKQSEVVFEHVQQGIFLLDKELKISNLYSKAVERIFDNKIIANENFSNFMRPRLIQRDFEALEMFMRHLFNEDMDEDVVNQLNPIEQVKIFIGTNGVVITKHLRVSFTRIERQGVIQNIMVTISDETESVLLQQHMEEAESQKKRETEYMLSILKVEPKVLREFLDKSKEILKSISDRYETSGNADLNSLLDFTFQIIHNVKGHAVSIGLQLITDKLHEIEESIVALKEKNVSSDDFLSILYEIEEVYKIIGDVDKVHEQIADIYRNFPTPKNGHSLPNGQLIESLEASLKFMGKESGKDVCFTFTNPENIVIPESQVSPIKDMMVQLMRNSLSHGIESPVERTSKGKEEQATVAISLNNGGDGIHISYRDDGQGLDTEKIIEKAISNGTIKKSNAKTLDNEQLVGLIFADGFSTTEKVNKYSGRGQGLSVIRTVIEEQKGSFAINFEKGKFFEMIISIPTLNGKKLEKVA